jgi:hypothetical protein
MEEAHGQLRDYEEFLRQVEELKQLVETAFKHALDRAIPPLNDLLTEVYQRLTHQRSFELVRVHHDPERIGHLELRVASKRRPDTDYPDERPERPSEQGASSCSIFCVLTVPA